MSGCERIALHVSAVIHLRIIPDASCLCRKDKGGYVICPGALMMSCPPCLQGWRALSCRARAADADCGQPKDLQDPRLVP